MTINYRNLIVYVCGMGVIDDKYLAADPWSIPVILGDFKATVIFPGISASSPLGSHS